MFKTYIGAQAGSGSGRLAAVSGPAAKGAGPGGWEPSVLYMLGLTVLEVAAVALLSRHLLK
jgi:hypothetical protein